MATIPDGITFALRGYMYFGIRMITPRQDRIKGQGACLWMAYHEAGHLLGYGYRNHMSSARDAIRRVCVKDAAKRPDIR